MASSERVRTQPIAPTAPSVRVAATPDEARPSRDLLASLLTMAWVVEARDPYTGGHLWRVSRYAQRLATAVGRDAREIARVAVGGFIHDIGKVGVPDAVLRKPGPLTDDERAVLQTHPILGLRMLAAHPLVAYVRDAVGAHHEQPDGGGYPQGLAGADVPAGARIIAIADAFDAMTSARPYRRGLPPPDALTRISRGLGTQFDTQLGDVFCQLVRGGAVDDVLGHSDDAIPLHECALCGNAVVIRRGTPDHSVVHCANCGSEFRVRGENGMGGIVPTGRRAGPAEMVADVDHDLIARVVNESTALLVAT